MWCATMALNGLIGRGVPQDWATHMIGHELTALFGLDHAQTLAIILPNLLWVQRGIKREKLLQYAGRVWDLQRRQRGPAPGEGHHRRPGRSSRPWAIPPTSTPIPSTWTASGRWWTRLEGRRALPLGEKKDLTSDRILEILALSR